MFGYQCPNKVGPYKKSQIVENKNDADCSFDVIFFTMKTVILAAVSTVIECCVLTVQYNRCKALQSNV